MDGLGVGSPRAVGLGGSRECSGPGLKLLAIQEHDRRAADGSRTARLLGRKPRRRQTQPD